MRVHEIAKSTGLDSKEVAGELGITSDKAHLVDVDDEKAAAYIAEKGGTPPAPKESKAPLARFWSPKRNHYIPGSADADGKTVREDIRFRDWSYEAKKDSVEAEFLRSQDVRDRIGIREVFNKPYPDVELAVEFEQYLLSLIFTGHAREDGPSREGMRCVQALLTEGEGDKLTTAERNTPKGLVKAVRLSKSMNVDTFETGV